MSSYERYVKDEGFLAYYNDYQKRWATQIAERDHAMIDLIALQTWGKGSLLDIGCSTGNLLQHIRQSFPNMRLTGGELAESSLHKAKGNPSLKGVDLKRMNMLAIEGRYDCIVCNAVTYLFDNDLFAKALRSVSSALNPGGSFIDFEWFNPWNQHLVIRETCVSHPNGLTLNVRTYDEVREMMGAVGLEAVEFAPFHMKSDLPEGDPSGDVITYTRKIEDGPRLSMRGAIHQPWCHVTARKSSP